MHTQGYVVSTEVFSGPLDLLLTLIEKRKLHINDISLAGVSDDFVKYVEEERKKGFPLEQIADFLIIASTLLLIKSKSLLPVLDLSPEEEESMEDLENRLNLYKRFRGLARKLRENFATHVLFEKEITKNYDPIFSPDKNTSVKSVHKSIKAVLNSLPKEKEQIPETKVRKVISIEEMVDRLSERMQRSINIKFKDFVSKEDKITVIVGFLAMLELVKQGVMSVQQDKQFSDIMMKSSDVNTPQYN